MIYERDLLNNSSSDYASTLYHSTSWLKTS